MEPFTNNFHCPLCHSSDAVTKVSSIVSGGTATSIGYHAAGRASGTSVTISKTALARKLTPPSLPTPPIEAGTVGCGVTVLSGCGLFFIGMGYFLLSTARSSASDDGKILVSIGAIWSFLWSSIHKGDLWSSTGVGPGIIALVLGLVCIAYLLLAIIITAIIREIKRPRWKQAMEIWDKLYYCARNDVVYLPGLPAECAVSPSQMKKVLYPPQA